MMIVITIMFMMGEIPFFTSLIIGLSLSVPISALFYASLVLPRSRKEMNQPTNDNTSQANDSTPPEKSFNITVDVLVYKFISKFMAEFKSSSEKYFFKKFYAFDLEMNDFHISRFGNNSFYFGSSDIGKYLVLCSVNESNYITEISISLKETVSQFDIYNINNENYFYAIMALSITMAIGEYDCISDVYYAFGNQLASSYTRESAISYEIKSYKASDDYADYELRYLTAPNAFSPPFRCVITPK